MNTQTLNGNTFRRILRGGAYSLHAHMEAINDLNVFPVPDGDTGTNMSQTIQSGISRISDAEYVALRDVANDFSKGTLFGARGNSGVILSQFFAGLCNALIDKEDASAHEVASAYRAGVTRAYSAVTNPVEGTILTVFRESAEYALSHLPADGSLEDFFKLHIEEAERSLKRTKDILPVLTEADVVDSGGAGYLCIAKGMYEALMSDAEPNELPTAQISFNASSVNYDLFSTDSVLEFGYCTECLLRIQRAKISPQSLDEKEISQKLTDMGCDSIVLIKDGDVLKLHAHTKTPGDILALCQNYGEFLNIKIENMSLQHSEKVMASPKKAKTPHKAYGVVTVATGDGMKTLFGALGADVIIHGGQTGNPSTEEFITAFEALDADHILVLPNNKNIYLTALQAAELWGRGNVSVIPTKTIPQGYVALSVFNPLAETLEDQLSDMQEATRDVVSGEITTAIRDTVVNGVCVKEGDYIGILDGKLVTSELAVLDAMTHVLQEIPDLDDRELVTLFVGSGVHDDERVSVTEALEAQFPTLSFEVIMGGQEVYSYLIAVE